MQTHITHHRGFTLIEILVAMTIIAIAMAALVKASGDYTASASYIKQKTLAHYVAMNELNKLQISNTFPSLGTEKSTVKLAGHDWSVTREILETADKSTHAARFNVFVTPDSKQAIAHLQGYLSQHTGALAAGSPP